MARRKSAPVNAPTTTVEATALLGEYARGITTIEGVRAHYDAIIADLQAERDAIIAPVETGLKDLFISLRAWWAVAADSVTGGKRKTAEIAGCLVGIRTTPPSLKLPKASVLSQEDLIDKLIEEYGPAYVTFTTKLNKPALIADLRKPVGRLQETLVCDFHLSTSQREEFFIDRMKTETLGDDPITAPDEALVQGEAA